jgi:hypothetical protein
MGSRPSTEAWVALVVLLALFLASAFLERARESAPSAEPALPNWAMSAATAAGLCPAAAAVIQGASLSAVVWWLLLAPVATGVLLAVVGTTATIAVRWPRWRCELTLEERATVYVVVVLSVASALAVPAVSVAVLMVDGEVPLAAALSLTAAYVLWRSALEVTRRSHHFGVSPNNGSAVHR